ncbi:hypothetical protein HN832_03145 [archaeon]|jgi:hypothetical protein|nr:hypothetical protein [archaeon]MBT4373608.1 hypothetical protein [archaeon]MBT4532056.1 hypothetical protein [archaeon]MBT7001723.1 hypothetical protein [archaeon]MBT7282385.1 hypothetical protein [archaeon]
MNEIRVGRNFTSQNDLETFARTAILNLDKSLRIYDFNSPTQQRHVVAAIQNCMAHDKGHYSHDSNEIRGEYEVTEL